ncbi:type-1 fimbrial protein subunit A [Burkholderia lata]|uniref:Type-1 fimbrial protein subunit A n=2 Tax=Burkholderia lata (strain ATCC 17760 / DSM 23089 / LMG 22485 / NCIMB 9086 / R18194 / 383) TaxID=482957 RepID=A0A6P2J2E2_BURL3|nr:type-1 fimbrial protein subunit A [Burkholderia lata]
MVGEVATSVYTVSFNALPTFDPTVPDGTVLARAQSPMGTQYTWVGGCTNNLVGPFLYTGIGALDSRFNTYPTGIAGIGVRVGNTNASDVRWWANYLAPNAGVASMTFTPKFSFVIELVKTGRITAPGALSGEIGRISLVDHGGQVPISVRLSWSVAVKPLVPSCVVNTKKIAVPMGSAAIATLNRDGVGPGRDFAINLQCTGGTQGATTRMFITLTDATNAGNRGNVLGLTPNSTAKGVGVRIMNKSTPVSFGPDSSAAGTPNQWFVTETGNRGVDIPLTARYVRTGNITPGTADAIATFTMSYQ